MILTCRDRTKNAPVQITCMLLLVTANPDFQMGGGGGGASYPDPQIRGQSPKMFFSAFQSSVWSENKVGGGGQGPSPGSATDRVPDKTCFAGQTFEV